MKSWKTTAAGVGGLMSIIAATLTQLTDNNPATNPDWNLVVPLIFTSLIGIFARDNGVSSVDVGVDENTRHLKKPLPLILLTALLSLSALSFTGCATTPQTREAVVFKSFETTWTVAHSAYQAHCENVVTGKVTMAKELQVDRAWNKFRMVFKASFVAANQDWKQMPPDTLFAAEAELIKIIRSL